MPNKSIAIDPGYDRVGIAVFENDSLIFSECFTPPKGEFSERLAAIYEHLKKRTAEFAPSSLALETLFFSKNQKTVMRVSEARGMILLFGARHNLRIAEYSPQQVKIAVTGSGNADKKAVTRMVERLVVLPSGKRLDDEYDAIALGIAHTAHEKSAIHTKK